MCASNGASIYSSDFKKINLVNNAEVKKALNWYIDLAKAHAIPNPLDPPADWDGALFTAGKIAFSSTATGSAPWRYPTSPVTWGWRPRPSGARSV